MDVDHIKEKTKGGILLPDDHLKKERGGIQIATVLDVGESAFDDQPESVRKRFKPGCRIVTQRYPGSQLDLDPSKNDAGAHELRVILDTEVRCLEAEDGVHV